MPASIPTSGEDERRERYEEKRKSAGERRVNARFDREDLLRLKALCLHFDATEAEALRRAVRACYDRLPRQRGKGS